MQRRTNESIGELRGIMGLTQEEFAALIGASKDTVASWEVGRNKLSRSFARRIALVTGVREENLLRGRSVLMADVPMREPVPFTRETFEQHRTRYWGSTDETAARRHGRNGADALELILVAAARANNGKGGGPLPAVLESFVQWCEQTRVDFQLGEGIEQQLADRKTEVTVNQTYGEWRRKQKEDPGVCRAMGFKDDPEKKAKEQLRLSLETVPVWRPGHAMGRGRGKS